MTGGSNLETEIAKLLDEVAGQGGSMVTVLSDEARIVAEAAEKRGLLIIRAEGGAWEETEELSLTRRVRLQKGLPPVIHQPGLLSNAARVIAAVWASLRPWKA